MNKHQIKKSFGLILALSVLSLSLNTAHAQSKKAAPKEPSANCFISEFRYIGAAIHEPLEREKQAKNWLIQNVAACSVEKLKLINGNRASWLGTADSAFLMTMLDAMIEFKVAGNPEMLSQIFNSVGKEGTSTLQVTSVTQAPRAQAYDAQQYQYPQQYQQQAYTQPQPQPQKPAAPQMAYPQAGQAGGR